MVSKTVYQLSLNPYFGGGEVYTRFLVEAFTGLGWNAVLFVHRKARYWMQMPRLQMSECRIIAVDSAADVERYLPESGQIIFTHGSIEQSVRQRLAGQHRLYAMVHMPLYDFAPNIYDGYEKVFAVSAYVAQSLKDASVACAWPEPLYAVADIVPCCVEAAQKSIVKNSCYDWDRRKGRDRLLSWLEPWVRPLLPKRFFVQRPGITIAIVSRLTPIKQFPLLFSWLVPILSEFPQVNLEIFGAGGYASVRDLRAVLRPIRSQVHFWGFQSDVALVYAQVDFVLSGLPEQEALGLNLLEAQCCNTPVLAVQAPPFTETVVDGVTGYLYTDPRVDHGADFRRLLQRLQDRSTWPYPQAAAGHLSRFSFPAFGARIQNVINVLNW